jgi:hypothetical protein
MPQPLATLALCLTLVTLPDAARALACEEYSIRAAYWRHQQSADRYVLVLGQFSDLTFKRHDRAKDRVVWTARFTGHSASARAFDRPFAAQVTVIDNLYSAIDGGAPPIDRLSVTLESLRGLVFLKETASGYVVATELCVPLVDTDPAHVRPALACLAGRRCPRA